MTPINCIKAILLLLLLSPLSLSYAQPSTLEASIQQLESFIRINTDASMDVTERIMVYADQAKIRHGIVRLLPTHYMDSNGITHNTHYNIQQILVNNTASSYRTECSNQGFKIRIGSASAVLEPGMYVYTLHYHIQDAINFLKNYDEFRWNITGNGWDFPIAKATTTIQLPEGSSLRELKGYTGKVSHPNINNVTSITRGSKITFTTIRPLATDDNFIISISWQKGIIQKPGFTTKIKERFKQKYNASIQFALLFYKLIHGKFL